MNDIDKSKIRNIGTSKGLIIPAFYTKLLKLNIGDEVIISSKKDSIIIKKNTKK